jgi:hypothetical protein
MTALEVFVFADPVIITVFMGLYAQWIIRH